MSRAFARHRTRTVGGTKDPDVDAIVALEPDLVVMCVEENRRDDAEALGAHGLEVIALSIDSVDDVAVELDRLAAALQCEPSPLRLPDPLPTWCRAFVPIWRRPWMTLSGRTYAASLLEHLGIETVFVDAADRYPTVGLAEATARRPDLVIAPSEPYPFQERHRAELEQVAPVVFVDGQDLVWWGTRTPSALERLGAQLRR